MTLVWGWEKLANLLYGIHIGQNIYASICVFLLFSLSFYTGKQERLLFICLKEEPVSGSYQLRHSLEELIGFLDNSNKPAFNDSEYLYVTS